MTNDKFQLFKKLIYLELNQEKKNMSFINRFFNYKEMEDFVKTLIECVKEYDEYTIDDLKKLIKEFKHDN